MENQFIINGRFKVNAPINTVTDLETGIETRLEPRLMKLMMLLIMQRGEVVTRQQIITDIWDDYGNADEGLSQAVSFLRKTFADADKHLIRTIPKKGYILDAIVSTNTIAQPVTPRRKPGKLYLIIPIAMVMSVAIIYFLLSRTSGTPTEPPGSVIDTTYKYQEMKDSAYQIEQKAAEAEKK